VIFDMDGVIIDSHGTVNKLFTAIVNKHLGTEMTEEEFQRESGLRFDRRVKNLIREKGLDIMDEKVDEAMIIGRNEYLASYLDNVQAFPGALDLIESLRGEGRKLALGTNGSHESVNRIISNLGLIFDSIVTFSDVAWPKPSPDIFLKNAEELGAAPADCVVIEDSVEGVAAAKAAGMPVIAVTTTRSREELWQADHVVDSIRDVYGVIQSLNH